LGGREEWFVGSGYRRLVKPFGFQRPKQMEQLKPAYAFATMAGQYAVLADDCVGEWPRVI
jgi:hypothetical protein